ncbi:S-protein homolog 24-like [Papaver somniferum]|uniref:S-protein homolog 24-like n=1 Tax=Papaver somniferum TaxID=3469 RepID=UPI000E6F6960|nr:S-protein homolog 24-like [Papaver somniferum]
MMMMSGRNNKLTGALLLLVAVIFAVLVLSECSSRVLQDAHWDKTTVFLKNDISEKVLFNFHCYSSETDFGNHSLTYGHEFIWRFTVNLFGSTKYWCDMWFESEEGQRIQGGYHIYKATRDIDLCETDCHYSVRRDGVYVYKTTGWKNETGYVSLFKWPQVSKH